MVPIIFRGTETCTYTHTHTHATPTSSHLFHILQRMWVTHICFNDTLSALYWEIKGWYLQNLAQWGYNNILLPLMIDCSPLKGQEERLSKENKSALCSDFQQYVSSVSGRSQSLWGCIVCLNSDEQSAALLYPLYQTCTSNTPNGWWW